MYGVFFLMQVEKDCQYSREFMHLLTFFKSVKKKHLFGVGYIIWNDCS